MIRPTIAMTTPMNAASIASDEERQLRVPAARADQSHDADLGSSGVRRDLNHVGDQQDRADRLHQRHRERGVAQPVEHREQPVDQVLLVQHVEHAGLADDRVVEVLVLLGIVELDDERRGEGVLARDVLVLRELLDRVVVGVVAVEEAHRLDVVAVLDLLCAAPCTGRRRTSGRWPTRRWSGRPGSRPGPDRCRGSCRQGAPRADRRRTGRWRWRSSGSSRPSS